MVIRVSVRGVKAEKNYKFTTKTYPVFFTCTKNGFTHRIDQVCIKVVSGQFKTTVSVTSRIRT